MKQISDFDCNQSCVIKNADLPRETLLLFENICSGSLFKRDMLTICINKIELTFPSSRLFKPYGNTEMTYLVISATNFGNFEQFQSGFAKMSP